MPVQGQSLTPLSTIVTAIAGSRAELLHGGNVRDDEIRFMKKAEAAARRMSARLGRAFFADVGENTSVEGVIDRLALEMDATTAEMIGRMHAFVQTYGSMPDGRGDDVEDLFIEYRSAHIRSAFYLGHALGWRLAHEIGVGR